jgi:DNA-binding CsgD family transcriptional regulator
MSHDPNGVCSNRIAEIFYRGCEMASVDFARLSTVSDRLGEAVLDPTTWPSIMEAICLAVKTSGAALVQSDARTADIPKTASAQEIFDAYFYNNLHVNDVRAVRGVPLLLAGLPIVSDHDLFTSETEMMLDPLYATIDRYGFRWWAAVGFRSGSALWGLSLQRTKKEGQFQAPELAALGRLSRRLTETATLSKAVGRQVLHGITNALHLINQPALALDRCGFVVEANALATDLFDSEIRIKDGRLFVRDKTAKFALATLNGQIQNTSDRVALNAPPIIVRRQGKTPVVIRVLPVDGAARSPFLGARAVLVLTDTASRLKVEADLALAVFDLTPAEAKLAARIAVGWSLEQVATELTISRETARRHLKVVFSKTGTHRQGELVALLSLLRP